MSRLQAQGFSRGSFHCSHSNVISYLQLIRLSSLVLSLVSALGLPSTSVLQVLLICEGINTLIIIDLSVCLQSDYISLVC